MKLSHAVVETDWGGAVIFADDVGIKRVNLYEGEEPSVDTSCSSDRSSYPYLDAAREQLASYFAGDLRKFDLPLSLYGTDFQMLVWKGLMEIPYGQTVSYLQLAVSIGRPSACRAVGGANGRNPIPVIIPCHRVIGADGTLGGYSGGLDIKRRLLSLEGVHLV